MTEQERKGLKIRMVPVTELDPRCFVLILECGSDAVAGELARRADEKLAETGENIVLLRLGAENAARTAEERKALIQSCGADALIRLEMAEKSVRGSVTQAFCNTQYYIPGLDSVVLADLCESGVLAEIGGPAGNIAELAEDDPLRPLAAQRGLQKRKNREENSPWRKGREGKAPVERTKGNRSQKGGNHRPGIVTYRSILSESRPAHQNY